MVQPVRTDSDIRRVAVLEEKALSNERAHCDLGRAIEVMTSAIGELKEAVDQARGTSKFIAWFVPIILASSLGISTTISERRYASIENQFRDNTERIARLERLHMEKNKND